MKKVIKFLGYLLEFLPLILSIFKREAKEPKEPKSDKEDTVE